MREIEVIGADRNEKPCTTCKGRGLISCPAHGSRRNEYGDCGLCDAPVNGPGDLVTCPCQPK